MKLKPPDNSWADYVERRRQFMFALNATNPTAKERLACWRKWFDANCPLSASEKLANLRRALMEDD